MIDFNGGSYVTSTNTVVIRDQANDADGDYLYDTWEAQHHLNPGLGDTTDAYGGTIQSNGDIGDDELIADIQALVPMLISYAYWNRDWAGPENGTNYPAQGAPQTADGGQQWGQPYYAAPYAPISFFWNFHPYNASTKTYGNPVPVRSLKDLQAFDPNVLTSPAQL